MTESSQAPATDAKSSIAASDGRIVLPVVPGHPASVYFTIRNDGSKPVTLTGVQVTGVGTAEMHKTDGGSMVPVASVDLEPGATVEFAPGGYHIMAFDLAKTLKAGGVTKLVLAFSNGDKLPMPLRIETMGSGMAGDDMPGMHH